MRVPYIKIVCLIFSLLIFGACSENKNNQGTAADSQQNHKSAGSITGAGSSFVYPVLSKWSMEYHKAKGVEVNYQSIGSGGGLNQLNSRVIDFAASDKPLTKEELNRQGKFQFPVIVGGIVPIVHIPGTDAKGFTLDGKTLADIFLGNIKKWNDPSIKKLNPDIQLPDTKIMIISRADSSGTTFNFTNYLSKVSSEWEKKVGYSTNVQWPTTVLGAKGNAGVAAQVKTLPNTIGYVEYAFVSKVDLTVVTMINSEGNKVVPDQESFEAAASNAKWSAENGFYLFLTNSPGKKSWPIVATTWIIAYKSGSPAIKNSVLDFFSWAFDNGRKVAASLDYVAMPENVVKKIESSWGRSLSEKNMTGAGSSFVYPIMSIWTSAYKEQTGIKVNYQSTGSATGINMFKAGAADFSATEIPFSATEIEQMNVKVFPVTASGVVPVVNIPGVKNNQLTLSGSVLADIFMGKLKYWDDEPIQRLNRGLNLPHKNIIIVHRIGMSGTTYIFTSYLSKIDEDWKKNIGSNSEVIWPKGSLGGRENAGAAAYVKQIPFSIGYVDYNFINEEKISCVALINKAGNRVEANLVSFKSAVQNHPWEDVSLVLDVDGAGSWPIVAVTYILEKKGRQSNSIQDFFNYVLSSKRLMKKAHDMGYIVNDKIDYL